MPIGTDNEQQNGFKLNLYHISQSILSMDGNVSELSDHKARIKNVIFDVCFKVRRLLHTLIPVVRREGIKLPKINVQASNEDIMDWRRSWERCEIAIH